MIPPYRIPSPVALAIAAGAPAVKAFRLYCELPIDIFSGETCIPQERLVHIEAGAAPSEQEVARIADVLDVPAHLLA